MVRIIAVLGFLAAVLSGCSSREFENYITSNRGVIIVYGKNFAYTSFLPSGWASDKRMLQTNDLSLCLRPTNRSDNMIYSLGIVLTNSSGSHAGLANQLAETVFVRDLIADKQVEVIKTSNIFRIDRAREIYTYRIFNSQQAKGIYEEVTCVVWERSLVLIIFKAGSPAEYEQGLPVFRQFISGIKYWGHNSDDLANRVIKLFFGPQKKK